MKLPQVLPARNMIIPGILLGLAAIYIYNNVIPKVKAAIAARAA